MLEDAGRVGIPFTTGILIGIGENRTERAESLHALRRIGREYGHLQEVIVQNFRAKPDTAMRAAPDASLDDLAATVAVARLVLGPKARIQAPPNLLTSVGSAGDRGGRAAAAGRHRRLGRGVAGHAGPRQPGAAVAADRGAGPALRRGRVHSARAADHLPRVRAGLAGRGAVGRPAHRAARAGAGRPFHRARVVGGAFREGRPWQEPDATVDSGRVDLHETIDTTGRTSDRRSDFDTVYGDWAEVATHARSTSAPIRTSVAFGQ